MNVDRLSAESVVLSALQIMQFMQTVTIYV